jgi:hypothetical protein
MAKMTIENPPARTPLIHKKISKTAVNTDSIEAMTRDTDKPVKGTFINVECPGQPAKICGRYYRGMEYFAQTLEDNTQYTVPWSVARFINERCFTETHIYIVDEKGNPLKGGKKVPRYKFMIESM